MSTQQSCIQGGLHIRSNHFYPCVYKFLTENAAPLPTIEKKYPFHIPIKENCIPSLNLLMKLLMNDIMGNSNGSIRNIFIK